MAIRVSESEIMWFRRTFFLDDWKSIVHIITGILIQLLSKWFTPLVGIAILLAYTIYQWYEVEADINKVGDMLELMIGLALGGFIEKII